MAPQSPRVSGREGLSFFGHDSPKMNIGKTVEERGGTAVRRRCAPPLVRDLLAVIRSAKGDLVSQKCLFWVGIRGVYFY